MQRFGDIVVLQVLPPESDTGSSINLTPSHTKTLFRDRRANVSIVRFCFNTFAAIIRQLCASGAHARLRVSVALQLYL